MRSPFDVAPEHLNRLDPGEAVDLVRRLVSAEARESGIKESKIDVPANINAPDGGIDGVVRGAERDGKRGIIKKGTTAYQIKSGTFRAGEPSVRRIMLTQSRHLKNRIKACFEDGGTFVLAFTRWDAPASKAADVQEMLAQLAAEHGYAGARVEVWRQNTIIGFLRHFPTLALSVQGADGLPLLTHKEWKNLSDMKVQMHLGAEQRKFVNSVVAELRKDSHARMTISGDPGIGKTRLVLEATSADDLSPCVIYFEKPSCLHDALPYIHRQDGQVRMILVVDECGFEDQAEIWNHLNGKPSIALITIFTEEAGSVGVRRMSAPPLESAELAKIIRGYVGDDPHMPQWVEWCKPLPRVAHVVGENLKYNPHDLLKSPDNVDVWGRYIAGRDEAGLPKAAKRRKILRWLALFKRFGFESPHSDEADRIAKLVELDEGVPLGEFRDTIRELRQRKILQGGTTLYITPKLLHLHLWLEWWDTYGPDKFPSAQDLAPDGQASSGSDNLVNWSRAMFEYGKQHPKVIQISRELLASAAYSDLDEPSGFLNPDFFRILSKVVPDDALAYLERTICQKSKDELQKFETGRRQVVSALERMVLRGENLDGVARVLLKLAEAENEAWGNNATGVFQSMFKPSHPASKPDDMIRLMKDSAALAGAKAVVVGACNAALEDGGTFVMRDMDDLEPAPAPRRATRSERIRYRIRILDILMEQYDSMPGEVSKVVIHNAYSMIRAPELADRMVDALAKIRAAQGSDAELVRCMSSVLETGRLGDDAAGRLKALLDEISGTTFRSRMRRYVGMPRHIDVISEAVRAKRDKELDALAEAAANPDVLEPELGWLVTGAAEQGYEFGYRLAEKDPRWTLLPAIMQSLRDAGSGNAGAFIGGYMRRVCEKDAARWEAELDGIYSNEETRALLPWLVRGSGITDESVKKILRGIKDGRFGSDAMRHVVESSRVSESTFAECVDLLAESKDDAAASIALDMVYSRFVATGKKLPKEIAARVLLHDNVVDGPASWVWKEVGLEFVKQHPDEGIKTMEIVMGRMDGQDLPSLLMIKGAMLEAIIKAHPAEAWGVLAKHIGPPTDSKAYAIQKWLAGSALRRHDGIMSSIPMSEIVAWVGDDEARAAHIASFLPNNHGYVREFLSGYGDRPGVQGALAKNFRSAGWTGSSTTHYQKLKKETKDHLAKETDPKILSWLRFYARCIDEDMKRSSDLEERI